MLRRMGTQDLAVLALQHILEQTIPDKYVQSVVQFSDKLCLMATVLDWNAWLPYASCSASCAAQWTRLGAISINKQCYHTLPH
jgi:hypothetical protein